MKKHATGDVYVFCRVDRIWRIGLVKHPLWGRWVTPGGHVEADENPAEAAFRELLEETGILHARLVPPPGLALPPGFPSDRVVVPTPWMIVEMPIPGDNGLSDHHIHVDFQYLAVVETFDFLPSVEPLFGWFPEEDLSGRLDVFDDTRATATAMFSYLKGSPQTEERSG